MHAVRLWVRFDDRCQWIGRKLARLPKPAREALDAGQVGLDSPRRFAIPLPFGGQTGRVIVLDVLNRVPVGVVLECADKA